MRFDGFVAIDWSGAAGKGYRGIAVAQCRPGRGAPRLVAPPQAAWTRSDVFHWLTRQTRKRRLLVGIDMAFALPAPFEPPPAQWARIEAFCHGDADFAGQRVALADARFWRSGTRPANWIEHQRPAELACIEQGLGHPQTPLKLIGARQVGLGTLAGARLLHRLRSEQPQHWLIWPFDGQPQDDDARSVCVEMYPRLFIRHAGGGNAKLRDVAALATALRAFDSAAPRLTYVDDHQADALVSAAGLRHDADRESLWRAGIGQRHGWIFGVPAIRS